MKKLLSLFFLFYITTVSYAKPEEPMAMNKTYEIGGYILSPTDKAVYHTISYEKSKRMPDGSVMNVWLSDLVPNPEIDFKTSALIFMGNAIFLKEDLPIKTVDISSLEVIKNANLILSPSENKVYGASQIDITGHTHIRDAIFKNNTSEQLFYIPYDHGYKLVPIDLTLDNNSIQHLVGDFYVDKNGLYDFDSMQKLEPSNGKKIKPILFEKHLIYGHAAYAYSTANKGGKQGVQRIKLDATKIRLLNTRYDTYIGDDTILLKLPSRVKDLSAIIQPQDIIQIHTPEEPFSDWNNFDIATVQRNNNTAYYPSPFSRNRNHNNYTYSLIKTPKGFYGVTGSSLTLEATQLDNVMIYNLDQGDYEPIDVNQFKRITSNFYIYKNRLYYNDGSPVITNIDFNQLEPIKLNGRNTEFYTDGHALFAGYNLGKLTKEGDGKTTRMTLSPIYEKIDSASLHIVNENLLVDKDNIYKSSGEVIPIKDLGIPVIIK